VHGCRLAYHLFKASDLIQRLLQIRVDVLALAINSGVCSREQVSSKVIISQSLVLSSTIARNIACPSGRLCVTDGSNISLLTTLPNMAIPHYLRKVYLIHPSLKAKSRGSSTYPLFLLINTP